MKIVTLTMNPAIDASALVDRVTPDVKLRCKAPKFEPGGGGVNVSRAIQRLDGESLAIFPAGGPGGHLLLDLLEDENVPCRLIPIKNRTRQNLMIYEESGGRQYRFGMPGPRLAAHEWRQCLDKLFEADPRPDFVVASGSLPPKVPTDFYGRLAGLCRDKGIRLMVDTSGEPFRQAVRQGLFLVKPNLRELKALAGEDLEDEDRQEGFVQSLIADERCRYVVVSLGAAGALAAGPEGCKRLRSPTVTIRSKVGAGDSMVGGIVLALSRGEPFFRAVQYGVAAGAAAVMTPDSELCRREDVERLFAKIKNQAGEDN